MGVQLRILFAAGFVTEGGGDQVAGLHFLADAGAASDSGLCVAVFEDAEGDFDGLVVGGDDALIFLD